MFHGEGSKQNTVLTIVSPYLFITPAYLVFIVFLLGPAVFAIVMSLFNWTGLRSPVWHGLTNYIQILTDDVFWQVVRNTLFYSAVSIFVVIPLALLLALALNSPDLLFRNVWRAVYFAPIVTSTVAVSQSFLMLLNRDFGLLNVALARLGLSTYDWLGSRSLAIIPVAVIIVWRWTGLTSIYFLAGLQGIPSELYDAGEVDGANLFQSFWHITLPQIKPITLFVTVIVLIGSLQVFDEPQILTQGGPSNATRSVVQYLYSRGIEQFRFSYAATVGFVLFCTIALFSVLQFRFFQEQRKKAPLNGDAHGR